jgi:predicted SAM-dependent methyltransferase
MATKDNTKDIKDTKDTKTTTTKDPKIMTHKLHIGCGSKHLPGYLHVDAQQHAHVDIVCDIRNICNYIDKKSIDEIYACHILEHFQRKDVYKVLTDWHSLLKDGGVLRISVPDFESCVKMYQKDKLSLHDKLLGLLYGGQRPGGYDYHYMAYDYENLKRLLEHCGFGSISLYDAHDFLPHNFDDYSKAYIPHLDKLGQLMSLNVVCKKAGAPQPVDSYIKQISAIR